jgi:acyl dehydratase
MLRVGDKASTQKIFTKDDVKKYAELTGDFNPVHFDENFTKKTIFKKPIVQGPLVITLTTSLFANELPGPGSVYLSHNVKYLHPVYINDKINAVLEIIEITNKNHVLIKTTCTNEDGICVLDGIARVKKF